MLLRPNSLARYPAILTVANTFKNGSSKTQRQAITRLDCGFLSAFVPEVFEVEDRKLFAAVPRVHHLPPLQGIGLTDVRMSLVFVWWKAMRPNFFL